MNPPTHKWRLLYFSKVLCGLTRGVLFVCLVFCRYLNVVVVWRLPSSRWECLNLKKLCQGNTVPRKSIHTPWTFLLSQTLMMFIFLLEQQKICALFWNQKKWTVFNLKINKSQRPTFSTVKLALACFTVLPQILIYMAGSRWGAMEGQCPGRTGSRPCTEDIILINLLMVICADIETVINCFLWPALFFSLHSFYFINTLKMKVFQPLWDIIRGLKPAVQEPINPAGFS